MTNRIQLNEHIRASEVKNDPSASQYVPRIKPVCIRPDAKIDAFLYRGGGCIRPELMINMNEAFNTWLDGTTKGLKHSIEKILNAMNECCKSEGWLVEGDVILFRLMSKHGQNETFAKTADQIAEKIIQRRDNTKVINKAPHLSNSAQSV